MAYGECIVDDTKHVCERWLFGHLLIRLPSGLLVAMLRPADSDKIYDSAIGELINGHYGSVL